MSPGAEVAERAKGRSRRGSILIAIVVAAVLAGIAFDTKIVVIGSDEDLAGDVFSPEAFGVAEFPRIQTSVKDRAVDAVTLANAILADKTAASARYGVKAGVGSAIPVSFSGVVGEGKSGVYTIAVAEMPAEVGIRVQTGPAINGTELRDATGEIQFGQFTNQIEFQNAGAALNDEMKRLVLADIDPKALPGRTISVVGVFTLVNPKNWLVTPVEMTVE